MNSSAVPAKSSRMRWLERSLLLIGLLCLGAYAYAWIDTRYTQYKEEKALEAALARQAEAATPASKSDAAALSSFQEEPETASKPALEPGEEGDLIGRIEIPRIGVSAIVLEGIGSKTLRRGVGRIPNTSLPGEEGNLGLAAHRDSFFRGLKDIRKNDIISLQTVAGTYSYRVEWTEIVRPRDTYVLDETEVPALTLVTCYPFYYVGSAPQRFIVRARQVEEGEAGENLEGDSGVE